MTKFQNVLMSVVLIYAGLAVHGMCAMGEPGAAGSEKGASERGSLLAKVQEEESKQRKEIEEAKKQQEGKLFEYLEGQIQAGYPGDEHIKQFMYYLITRAENEFPLLSYEIIVKKAREAIERRYAGRDCYYTPMQSRPESDCLNYALK